MLNPFVFMSMANEENVGREIGDKEQSTAPPIEDESDSDVLVRILVSSGSGGLLGRTLVNTLEDWLDSSPLNWAEIFRDLILIFFGIRLGLVVGYRLLGGQDIKFSFRTVIYVLITLLATCTPYFIWLVIKH